jgi:hypothetical protein
LEFTGFQFLRWYDNIKEMVRVAIVYWPIMNQDRCTTVSRYSQGSPPDRVGEIGHGTV